MGLGPHNSVAPGAAQPGQPETKCLAAGPKKKQKGWVGSMMGGGDSVDSPNLGRFCRRGQLRMQNVPQLSFQEFIRTQG